MTKKEYIFKWIACFLVGLFGGVMVQATAKWITEL